MGKRDKQKKGKGAVKKAMKADTKIAAKHKRMLERVGERDIEEIVTELEQEQTRLLSVVETECSAPTPRSNFTLVAHPNQEELILFGGELYNGKEVTVYNDMFFYNVAKQQWRLLKAPGAPTARSGHQMVSIADEGGQLWLFGGEHASPSQLQFYHYKDLWVFGLQSRQWQKINASNGPSARSGHRMVAQQQRLILFGGFYDNYQSYCYYNDVHVFDLQLRQWLFVQTDGFAKPAPRSGCCMAACPDGKLLIWGGYTKTTLRKRVDRGLTFTDMFALTPNNTGEPGMNWSWTPVHASGMKTLPLNSVGCTTAKDGQMAICFGGVMDVDEDDDDLHGQFTQDLMALDLIALSWSKCELKPRDVETAGGDAARQMLEPMESEPVQPTTVTSCDGNCSGATSKSAASFMRMPSLFRKQSRLAPTPRMNAGLCTLNGVLYLFGGLYEESDRVYTYNDFYALDLQRLEAWQVLIPNNENVHEWLESDDEQSVAATTDADDDDDESSDDDSESESETLDKSAQNKDMDTD